jgi:hypothetical protein
MHLISDASFDLHLSAQLMGSPFLCLKGFHVGSGDRRFRFRQVEDRQTIDILHTHYLPGTPYVRSATALLREVAAFRVLCSKRHTALISQLELEHGIPFRVTMSTRVNRLAVRSLLEDFRVAIHNGFTSTPR